MKRYVYLILTICTLVYGCAAQRQSGEPAPGSGLETIEARVRYLGPDRSVLPDSHFPAEVVVLFPYISGAIFGNPRSAPVFQEHLSGDLEFTLTLGDADEALRQGSATLTREWLARGLVVAPADTRLARIGTFAFNAKTREAIGAGGFIDAASLDNLILVYVDRACHITGAFMLGKESYRHDIQLPGPGFHWVRVNRPGADTFELVYHPPAGRVDFSIHLLDLQNV